MKNVIMLSCLSLGVLSHSSARAEEHNEHPLANIRGTAIDLRTEGHAIAGSINGFLVLGNMDHSVGGSRITLLRDDQRMEAEFKKDAQGVLSGTVSRDFGDTKLVSTVEFVKVIPELKQMLFKLNQSEITVSINSERYENNHYIMPTFSTEINKQSVSFKLEGQASNGYAAHLILMILSAYDFGNQYIFQSYMNLAKVLENYTNKEGDAKLMLAPTRDLIAQGFKLMRLYAEKNPSCQAQYEVIYKELENLPAMDIVAADERYHDGKDLPAAPRFCYFGRSLVAHPYFNLLRLNEGLTTAERQSVAEEFEEVSRHVVKVKKNIDNPPSP